MSYINDALRKLQKEEKTRYVAYDHIVAAPWKKSKPSRKWLLIVGIGVVSFFAVEMIVFLYGIEDKKESAIQPVMQTISAPPRALTVVDETKPNTKVEFQPKEKTAKARTKQEVSEAKVFFAQALERQHEGKLEEAKSLYKKVVIIDPRNIQAFNNLGVIYMVEKNYKRAILRFNNALDIKQDYVDAHYNLACLYAQKNDVTRSLFYLKNAVEFNPEVRKWVKSDGDLKSLANLQEFKKLTEKQLN
jgi:tetratricopeptide (TPR) repeat protein